MVQRRKVAAKRKAAKKKTSSKKRSAKKAATKKKPAQKKAAKKTSARKTSTKKRPTKKAASAKSDNVVVLRFTELSINQLSTDTGMTRRTIRKRIGDAGIEKARLVRGFPVYRLKDVLPALFTASDGTTDPDKLRPFERRAFYQGENEKLKLQQERGELVPAFEVERTLGRLFKILTHGLDTLPDVLEREHAITGAALVAIDKRFDELREEMYRHITEESDENARGAAKIS